jgi:hypothetical protein
MKPARAALLLLLSLALSGPAAAETAGFVVRLGNDTTAVERYTRTPSRVEIDQVGRSPRVLQRHFVYELDSKGATRKATGLITAPGAPAGAPPVQRIVAAFTGDSMVLEVIRDTTVDVQRLRVPSGTVVLTFSSPWALYEGQTMKLAKLEADSLRAPLYPIGGTELGWVTVSRLGRDSMAIQTHNDRYHARVDRSGRILGTVPISGTQKFSIARVEKLDVPAMTASFAAREKQGGAMGVLSTRDTVRALVAGDSVWIDYSRPAKRGRTVFGGVVPWGQLWRTGANASTQLRTSRALQFGDVTVPAGNYSVWTIPSPEGWKLILNSETGQPGTAHKAEFDRFTIPMTVVALHEPAERFTISVAPAEPGGTLHLDWDTTRATATFKVVP